MVLTKLMFSRAEAFFAYTCMLPRAIHEYIDHVMNCEDIAFNLMWSGMSTALPRMTNVRVLDFGTKDGISARNNHLDSRSVCINKLVQLFGGVNQLRYSTLALQPYLKTKYTKSVRITGTRTHATHRPRPTRVRATLTSRRVCGGPRTPRHFWIRRRCSDRAEWPGSAAMPAISSVGATRVPPAVRRAQALLQSAEPAIRGSHLL